LVAVASGVLVLVAVASGVLVLVAVASGVLVLVAVASGVLVLVLVLVAAGDDAEPATVMAKTWRWPWVTDVGSVTLATALPAWSVIAA